MDSNSDPTMTFNKVGYCNYCSNALVQLNKRYYPNEEGAKKLEQLVNTVKSEGQGKKYDCIMGISGGLDSSYLAYLGYKWGLRVLAVHINDGYDTEVSKSNIKKLIEKTGFDYMVIEPDAEQFNALTLAYMKAGVPNIAVPQDNILFAFLYDCVKKYKISYFFSGSNLALESIWQTGNTWKNSDVVNIKNIHKRFGDKPINKLKFYSTIDKQFDRFFNKLHTVMPLDYIDYNRDRAFSELDEFCGFKYYGRKHLENILTAFVQLRWYPEKFNVDKRTWHYSSMIVSGQLTRVDALKLMHEPIYNKEEMSVYENIIADNMHITVDELEKLIVAPGHQHVEYGVEDDKLYFKVFEKFFNLGRKLKHKGK